MDDPYLSHDWRDWQNNHVWLHKGIVERARKRFDLPVGGKGVVNPEVAAWIPSVVFATVGAILLAQRAKERRGLLGRLFRR